MTSQQGVLLPAGKVDDPSSISLPTLNPNSQDASTLYASLFETSTTKGKAAVEVQDLPLNAHLQRQDRLLLIHASTSSSSQPVNRLANELLLHQQHGDAAASTSTSIKGQAHVLYAEANRNFTLNVDWQALHDVCYGAVLAKAGKQATTTTANLQELAEQFIEKREQLASRSQSNSRGTKVDNEEDEAWTDEEVEQPREPKKDVESDDENEAEGQNGDEDDEDDEDDDEDDEDDSEGSYEDESELESDEDDDDDPRKKALLEMIQQAIMKDGKLDLER